MQTFADKVIAFNRALTFTGRLPDGVGIMNPFQENPHALQSSEQFYRKYYHDRNTRHMILGINPGRHGGGLTGVPFTDPKRLRENCRIDFPGPSAHEPSSVFIYEMIEAYGGPEAFYGKMYINSISPLGFIRPGRTGKMVNYNYYDDRELAAACRNFMVESLEKQLAFGIERDVCFCLGTGKNYAAIQALNREYGFFKEIRALEHPRYVIQYKSKEMQKYLEKYIHEFSSLKE